MNNNEGTPLGSNLESTGQVMRQALLKEDNKIQSKSKKFKEKKTRERINPRLDSKSDRNWKVRRKTAKVVLNQKGPLEKDIPQPQTNTDIIVKRNNNWINVEM